MRKKASMSMSGKVTNHKNNESSSYILCMLSFITKILKNNKQDYI